MSERAFGLRWPARPLASSRYFFLAGAETTRASGPSPPRVKQSAEDGVISKKQPQSDQTPGSVGFRGLSARSLSHDAFPESGHDPEITCQVRSEELLLDGNSKQNLATFCQTWESEQVHRLMDLTMGKNLIDKDEYP